MSTAGDVKSRFPQMKDLSIMGGGFKLTEVGLNYEKLTDREWKIMNHFCSNIHKILQTSLFCVRVFVCV